MPRVIRRTRFLFLRWVVFLLIVGGVLAVCFLMYELDPIVYRQVQKSLDERFIKAQVSISSAHYVQKKGFELSHFKLIPNYSPDDGKRYRTTSRHSRKFPPLIEAERVRLVCKSSLDELARGKNIPISEIIFDSATIHVYRRPDGSWSLEALKFNPNIAPMKPAPVIQFRNATVEVHDLKDSKTERKLLLRNLDLTINPAQEQITDVFGNPAQNPDGTAKKFFLLPFSGTVESEFSRSVSFTGKFDSRQNAILLDADINGLHFNEEFRNSLPLELAERFHEIRFIRGEIHTHLTLASRLKELISARYRLEGRLVDGRSTDPRFPESLASLSTDFQVTNEGFCFPNLLVHHGDGTISLNVVQRGYGPGSPKRILSRFQNINISDALLASLPEKLGIFLKSLSPDGLFNMEAEFLYDGQFWTPNGKIQFSDLRINYVKFPYEIKQLAGEVLLKENLVQFDFQTQNSLTRISGDFLLSSRQNVQPPSGKLAIQAQKLPADARLLAACPKETADFLRDLELGGSINLRADYRLSHESGMSKSSLNLRVDLQKNSCCYKSFPYPLRDMEGTILVNDHAISAENIRGFNQNAEVAFSFHAVFPQSLFQSQNTSPIPDVTSAVPLQAFQVSNANAEDAGLSFHPMPTGKKPTEWDFSLVGTNVQLNGGLFANLPPNLAGIFRYIQPRGPVNVRYEYKSPGGSVSAERPKHLVLWVNTTNEGIQIDFPEMNYTLSKFQGNFQYQNGQFQLTDFDAEHDSTHFSGKASGTVQSVNQWNFHFDRLTIDGLAFDRDLMLALPSEARLMIASKRPSGALFYSGTLDVHYDSQQVKPFSIDWDGEFGIVDGSIDVAFPVTAINGGVQLRGHWDQNAFYCGGELNIESLFRQNIQFTKVQGPIWIDNQKLILGGKADKLLREKLNFQQTAPQSTSAVSARAISLHCMAGTLYGIFELQFGYPSTFQSHVVLTDGHLEDCAILTGNNQLKGKIFGELTLAGTDSSMHSLRGKGEFHLVDADVYKLSVMMSLLKILSLKEVNDSGFSTGDAEFHIDGNHIYFDKIVFSGDAFSLIGKGEMDFKSQVKLVFYTVMGRNERNIPVVSPLLHATGRQMLLITMKGPIQNPQISQKPLPGINMAIQQMGEDLLSPGGQNKKESLK
ncbi:MAG: hypothetical protein IJQ31_08785 [Thermoguttaceae bacterium]|nr:hypothetical protein [Thermoguttaceae bacterium]